MKHQVKTFEPCVNLTEKETCIAAAKDRDIRAGSERQL